MPVPFTTRRGQGAASASAFAMARRSSSPSGAGWLALLAQRGPHGLGDRPLREVAARLAQAAHQPVHRGQSPAGIGLDLWLRFHTFSSRFFVRFQGPC
jgi:hypothetical protein